MGLINLRLNIQLFKTESQIMLFMMKTKKLYLYIQHLQSVKKVLFWIMKLKCQVKQNGSMLLQERLVYRCMDLRYINQQKTY